MYTVFTEVAWWGLTGQRVQRHQFEERGEADRWARIARSECGVVNVWIEDATGRVVDGVVSVRYVVVTRDASDEEGRTYFDTPEAADAHLGRVWDRFPYCKLTTESLA